MVQQSPLEVRFHDVPEVLAMARAYEQAAEAWDDEALDDYHRAVEELFEPGGPLQDLVIDRAAELLGEPDAAFDLADRVTAVLDRAARYPRHARMRMGAVIALQALEEGFWGETTVLWELEHRAGVFVEGVLRGARAYA